MALRVITDVEDLQDKTVLVRTDYNVPVNGQREVTDDARVAGTLRTLNYLLQHGAKVVIASHFGRPRETREFQEEFSLGPVRLVLERLLGRPVILAPLDRREACIAVKALRSGEVLMLENLRFDPGEKSNDPDFVDYLASLVDLVVDEAFGAMHRKHASIVGVEECLPSYAGFLVESEVAAFQKLLDPMLRGLTLVLGGAKVDDKIGMIERLLDRTQTLIIGGAMFNAFLAAQGHEIGKQIDRVSVDYARQLTAKTSDRLNLVLPNDVTLSNGRSCRVKDIPAHGEAWDIGKESRRRFAHIIGDSSCIFWNGPMGMFERPPFDLGTRAIAYSMALNRDAFTMVGGGDSAAAVRQFGVEHLITHVSTGGGASLEFIERGTLPGLEVLGYGQ
jgi:phosphoglycerate kinase